jgi:molybdate transport system ATP-binding protein
MLEARIVKRLRDYTLDLTLRVEYGQSLVLMGENGAGKSTTLNIIAGLLVPDAGIIRLNGLAIFDAETGTDIPVEDRRIGYVFQNAAVFPHMTVQENVAFGLRAQHADRRLTEQRVSYWLDCLDIRDFADLKAARLSGGQKQRVALARALATEPALLMLDEPFAGLDTDSTRSVKNAIRQCVADLSIPCLMVSHRISDARDIGNRVCLLHQGKITWEGEPAQIPGDGVT